MGSEVETLVAQRRRDAFLAIHYHDARDHVETWELYMPDGLVHVFNSMNWEEDYQVTQAEMQHIQEALTTCGLTSADDLRAPEVQDTAVLSVEWKLPDHQQGSVRNFAYPAREHSAMECLMNLLRQIETQHVERDP